MLRMPLFITILLLVSAAMAQTEPTSRPSASQLALYLPAEPPGSEPDYSILVELTNNETETIAPLGRPFWQLVDPSRDDIRERKVRDEWRILIAFHYSPAGSFASGGSWRAPHFEPISVAPGQTVLLRATTTKQYLPPGPIQVRALLQHHGQTIVASREITIDRVK